MEVKKEDSKEKQHRFRILTWARILFIEPFCKLYIIGNTYFTLLATTKKSKLNMKKVASSSSYILRILHLYMKDERQNE